MTVGKKNLETLQQNPKGKTSKLLIWRGRKETQMEMVRLATGIKIPSTHCSC